MSKGRSFEGEPLVEGKVIIEHVGGLHARPSVKLTQLAASFSSHIHIRFDHDPGWVNAKSIVKVMKLKIPAQATLHLKAHGPDAHEAIAAIIRFVETDHDFAGA